MSALASETNINLRAPVAKKEIIDRAADVMHMTRTQFMLEASVDRAETVLADRKQFVLSETQMAAFQAAMEAPLPDPDALRRLMARVPAWER